MSGRTVTYEDRRRQVEPVAAQLERIAYRLRQGAISNESAARALAEVTATVEGWTA